MTMTHQWLSGVVEEIKHFLIVNLNGRGFNAERCTFRVRLHLVKEILKRSCDDALRRVLQLIFASSQLLLQARHGERLSTTRLPVSKACVFVSTHGVSDQLIDARQVEKFTLIPKHNNTP